MPRKSKPKNLWVVFASCNAWFSFREQDEAKQFSQRHDYPTIKEFREVAKKKTKRTRGRR
jgi:hypothetical protein